MSGRLRRGISCFVNARFGPIKSFETTDLCLIVTLQNLTVACFYCPPTLNCTQFKTGLLESLAMINMTCNLVVAGDFNARIDPRGKAKNVLGAQKGVILCDILSKFDLIFANQEDDVTFISGEGTSTIDLIFFDPSFLELQLRILLIASIFQLSQDFLSQISRLKINLRNCILAIN
jgi:hypothetical protein